MRSTPTLNALSYPPVVRVTTMVVVVGATVSFSPLTVSVIVFPPTARPPRVTLQERAVAVHSVHGRSVDDLQRGAVCRGTSDGKARPVGRSRIARQSPRERPPAAFTPPTAGAVQRRPGYTRTRQLAAARPLMASRKPSSKNGLPPEVLNVPRRADKCLYRALLSQRYVLASLVPHFQVTSRDGGVFADAFVRVAFEDQYITV